MAGAMHDTTMELPLGELVVDHIADIVDRDIGDDLGGTGLAVDLDLRNMGAARKGARRRHFRDRVERVGRTTDMARNDLAEGDGLVGALDRVAAVAELDIER